MTDDAIDLQSQARIERAHKDVTALVAKYELALRALPRAARVEGMSEPAALVAREVLSRRGRRIECSKLSDRTNIIITFIQFKFTFTLM